ncbi:hypothetical protein JCM19233_497 [Vibrio astriarenae]|nr:hypothetical protein JCM19233_497 [Vibrio sp. C7]
MVLRVAHIRFELFLLTHCGINSNTELVGFTGLIKKSCAPKRIASTAVSIEPWAVMKMTGTSGCVFFTISRTSIPVISGRRRSSRIRSGIRWLRLSIASCPLTTILISMPRGVR